MGNGSFKGGIGRNDPDMIKKTEHEASSQLSFEQTPDNDISHWDDPIYTKVGANTGKVFSPNHYGEQSGYGVYRQSTVPSYEKKEESKSEGSSFGVLIIVCAIICSLCSAVAAWVTINHRLDGSNTVVLGSQVLSDGKDSSDNGDVYYTGDKMTPAEIYSLSMTQVVGINSGADTNYLGQFTFSAVDGSGFIVSEDGYIITNYHVIENTVLHDGPLHVITSSGTEYEATVIGFDDLQDIAVIKIDETGLTPVTFANSDNLSAGETIYAVGNPLGELSCSMTPGIISSKCREITLSSSGPINMFQISADVNYGNSGGPVYDESGAVLGLITATSSETGIDGVGFAIPINDVLSTVMTIIENGNVGGQPTLGIVVQTMDSSFASYYSVPQGAYVREVASGSCADEAGIKVGDIIIAFNSNTISSRDDLLAALESVSAGDNITVTVYRSGVKETLSIELDEKMPVRY